MGIPAPITMRQIQAAADSYVIAGSWGTNGNSAIVTTTVKGYEFTPTQDSSSNGNYTITFTTQGASLLAAVASAQTADENVDIYAQVGRYDPSAGTLKIRLMTAAVPTQLASNANNRINFIAWFQRNDLR